MEEIINIIIRIAATLLLFGLGWLGRYLVKWLKTRLSDSDAAKLDLFITELVAAAEQLYRNGDPGGEKRLDYVQRMLVEAGYDITDMVRALIESKVYDINVTNAIRNSATHTE